MEINYAYEASSTVEDIVNRIQQNAVDSPDIERLKDGEAGWGQYLDPNSSQDHVGTYGTTTGFRLLNLRNNNSRGQSGELKIKSLSWLHRQWSDSESTTNRRKDRANTYRVAFFARMLSTYNGSDVDFPIDEFSTDVCRRLWDMRIDEGWPQYNYLDGSGRHDEPDLLATAFAIYCLSECEEYHSNIEYLERLIQLSDEVINSRNSVGDKLFLLTASFSVLSLCSVHNEGKYKIEDGGLDNDLIKDIMNSDKSLADLIKQRTLKLVKYIRSKLRNNMNSNYYRDEFYVRLYSTPEPEIKYTYLPFLIGPIVMMAIVSTKNIDEKILNENISIIETMVQYYTTRTGDAGRYVSDIRGPASIGDHLWIAEFLNEYSKLESDNLSGLRQRWGNIKYWMKPNYAMLTTVLIAVIALTTLAMLYPNRVQFSTTLIGAIIGAVLTEVATALSAAN